MSPEIPEVAAPGHYLPIEAPNPGDWHDVLRRTLNTVVFGRALHQRQFAFWLSVTPLERITMKQWSHALRLAYRYRRQLPAWLVPPKHLVAELTAWRPRSAKQIDDAHVEARRAGGRAFAELRCQTCGAELLDAIAARGGAIGSGRGFKA
jgi:hypothetical protein